MYGRGKIVSEADSFPSLNVKGLDALDMVTFKPNGDRWNVDLSSDRAEAVELIDRLKPAWLIL